MQKNFDEKDVVITAAAGRGVGGSVCDWVLFDWEVFGSLGCGVLVSAGDVRVACIQWYARMIS